MELQQLLDFAAKKKKPAARTARKHRPFGELQRSAPRVAGRLRLSGHSRGKTLGAHHSVTAPPPPALPRRESCVRLCVRAGGRLEGAEYQTEDADVNERAAYTRLINTDRKQ